MKSDSVGEGESKSAKKRERERERERKKEREREPFVWPHISASFPLGDSINSA